MASNVEREICPCCTKAATSYCATCRDIKYCSRECQKSDWKYHKQLCKSLLDFQPSERPAPNMRRVVVFPADGTAPEFAWLPIIRHGRFIADEEWQSPDAAEIMGEKNSLYLAIPLNVRNDQPLEQHIHLLYDDDFELKYSKVNQAHIAAISGKARFSWKGPLIAYTGDVCSATTDIATVHDFNMTQYSALIAFLRFFNGANEKDVFARYKELTLPRIRAVKVLGQSSRVAGQPIFEAVEINEEHPVFFGIDTHGRFVRAVVGDQAISEKSSISEHIGMPLRLWQFSPSSSATNEHSNPEVSYMNLCLDPQSESFGHATSGWATGEVADVLIARHDKGHLSVETVEAFAEYCKHHVMPCVIGAYRHIDVFQLDDTETLQKKSWVLNEITPMKWSTYNDQRRKLNAGAEGVLKHTVDGEPRMGLSEADGQSAFDRMWVMSAFPSSTVKGDEDR